MLLIHFVKTTVVDHFDNVYFHFIEIRGMSVLVTGRMIHGSSRSQALCGRVAAHFCTVSLKTISFVETPVSSLTLVVNASSNQGKRCSLYQEQKV